LTGINDKPGCRKSSRDAPDSQPEGIGPINWSNPWAAQALKLDGPSWTLYHTLYLKKCDMAHQPQKIPLVFYRSATGTEPVRDWLRELEEAERHAIGRDLMRAQWRWPVGMPLCRPMGNGLWEVRIDLPTKRTARVLICVYREHLVALHGFIKKTRATPDEDLASARKRQRELASKS
jgi:phage-related protein